MLTRREFIAGSLAFGVWSSRHDWVFSKTLPPVVNDIHSQLNSTHVDRIMRPTSVEELQAVVRSAGLEGKALSLAGGRHAMGGQQFGTGTVLVDTTGLDRILSFDSDRGLIEVGAGIFWPELIRGYLQMQKEPSPRWGIAQKQTGADRLTIGGTLAANAHGRGLAMKPVIADVESFRLVDAEGNLLACSRSKSPELFRLAIGGYGLFGVMASVTLRLVPRQKLERVVEVRNVEGLIGSFESRIRDGFLYGDFQYSIDPNSSDFLRKGVFSCYRPVDPKTPMPEKQKELSDDDWRRLLYYAHADKKKVFEEYSNYYLSTNGQLYWSDRHQLSVYPSGYHREIDRRLHARHPATEIISEINVPRPALEGFLEEVRQDFRGNHVEVIYGTIRLIERDDDSFLSWAKQPYACTIFNLHTEHSPQGLEHSAEAFRRLIDMAIRHGGTYYLTYHRYATRKQVEACYPEFAQFLRLKRKYDPKERFQSDWYRHYRQMFADSL